MIWLITANTNSCRIFDYEKNPKKLTLIKELLHPDAKLKGRDLVSDRPGHYNTSTPTRGAFSSNEEPKEVEIERFSKEIADVLEEGRNNHSYKTLILAVPPRMNGLVHQHLNKHIKECILHDIKKDYTHLTEPEMLDALQKDIAH